MVRPHIVWLAEPSILIQASWSMWFWKSSTFIIINLNTFSELIKGISFHLISAEWRISGLWMVDFISSVLLWCCKSSWSFSFEDDASDTDSPLNNLVNGDSLSPNSTTYMCFLGKRQQIKEAVKTVRKVIRQVLNEIIPSCTLIALRQQSLETLFEVWSIHFLSPTASMMLAVVVFFTSSSSNSKGAPKLHVFISFQKKNVASLRTIIFEAS